MSTSAQAINLVEDALLAKDESALAEAIFGLGGGYMWGSLELRAFERAQDEATRDLAYALYRVVVNGKKPSLGAWNNLFWNLITVKEQPPQDEVRSLLERGLAQGPMNPSIFHNAACVAVKYGFEDVAFEAIAGAAKYGYELMPQLRRDTDLAPIAKDPRFEVAVNATITWTPEELEKLTFRLESGEDSFVVHRAVLGMTFYLGGPLHESAPKVLPLLDTYLAEIPDGTMTHYSRQNTWKSLTKAMLTREKKSLGELPPRSYMQAVHLRPTDGDAAEYDFRAEGHRDERAVIVTLAFPLAEANDPDAFEARFARYAELVGAEAAHAGYAFTNRDAASYEGLEWKRDALGARLPGLQTRSTYWRPGRAPPGHWLVWLAKAGLAAKVGADIGEAKRTETAGGVVLRASRLPSATMDAGALPDVARTLAPFMLEANGDANKAHLARWNEAKSTPWDNAPAGWQAAATRLTTFDPNAPPPPKKKKAAAKKKSFFDE